jgi:TatD DNase family protein
MTRLVDSHCHLDFPSLAAEQAEVVARARKAGVWPLLTISTRLQAADAIKAIADQHDGVYCSVGVHPDHVAEADEDISVANLLAAADHPKVVGLGESGLDYYYDAAERGLTTEAYHARQRKSFEIHLQAAIAADLPIIVHSRQAEADTAQWLRDAGAGSEPRLRGVMHCFSSGPELAEAALAMGFYISFSGIITFKKSEALRTIAATVPLDRLLIETDAPFLAPEPFRGKNNEPAYLVHTATKLAEIKGVSLQELAARTNENFHRLFNHVPWPTS